MNNGICGCDCCKKAFANLATFYNELDIIKKQYDGYIEDLKTALYFYEKPETYQGPKNTQLNKFLKTDWAAIVKDSGKTARIALNKIINLK